MKARPFFSYYGGKWRSAPRYPTPAYRTLIEPFAGSAGYSVRHATRDVRLYDLDERVVGVWKYLIQTPAEEIARLPLWDDLLYRTTDDMPVCQEARWLIGWRMQKGAPGPGKTPPAWMRAGDTSTGNFWGPVVRDTLARQVDLIRHWRVEQRAWGDVPTSQDATWFVDPPYQAAGGHVYRHGNRGIDYTALGEWCRSLPGQAIVCEGPGADWLPFRPAFAAKTNATSPRSSKQMTEYVWLGGEGLL